MTDPTTTDEDRIDVPVAFDVPEGWTSVDPATSGAPGAAFVLLADGDWPGFTPNVTVGVTRRSDDVDIEAAAAESVRRLTAVGLQVSVVDNQPVGNDRAPGVAQVLGLRAADLRLVQSQVHLTIPLGDAPHDRLVIELACTCRPDQAARVVPDFQKLVASFHLRQGDQQ
ncbi:MAG TPA: LpqN/LpqT family lipoprotein [Pseudonocardiaceae bacterium]|jgi:hypothetical protein|nr:LpqN/LpqT family lipoprotein [Pseudonocardiaceae bacterium]